MKKLLAVTIFLGVLSVFFMGLFFLASTDIYHDFIGRNIISGGIIGNNITLPDYTACRGEWRIVNIDLALRAVFMVLVLIVLYDVRKNYNKE